MAKRRRKTRTHLKGPNNSEDTATNAPKTFVIKTGKTPRSVSALVQDTRKVMEPNTATRLKERKSNKMKDFLTMAGPLGVTHMMIFGQTEAGTNLRIARCPRGPTVTFRVNKYALTRDILAAARRPRAPGNEFTTPPLLVLNNFGGEEKHIKLLVATFQNLFPPIQVQTMRLSQARRIVLLNYNSATKTIDWRHYLISVRPVGVSRAVRRVIEGTTRASAASSGSVTGKGTSIPGAPARRKGKSLVNLGDAGDIAEYVLGRSAGLDGATDTEASEAESEAEDMADPKNAVELPQDYVGRGNDANAQRAVRLREIGPRMELRLVKVEEGMNGGEVLYHDYVRKTAAQAAAQNKEFAEKKKLAAERRAEQEANVERKKAEKEARKKTKKGSASVAEDEEDGGDEHEEDEEEGEEEEDEFEYEDRFGPGAQADRVDGEGSGLDEELFSEGEEEEDLDDDEDDEEGEEDSDLEPIQVGETEYDFDSDDAPSSKKSKTMGSATAGRDANKARGKKKAGGRARR
ncbi:Brix-domain-containing protein [Violaceomyces palustris]|uniref:Brix-domain-containing protein n=1 Tax=Violaceomyces palustris TaxID=1673888 RepID=A0ACD0NV01_9BASI|nr:Brix-domain-containing protein [Violaceomyces palustris]